jgi:hypothetical protein
MHTAELHAYNFGRRVRGAGLSLVFLTPDQVEANASYLTPEELAAVLRLGPDLFYAWSARGWTEAAPHELGG